MVLNPFKKAIIKTECQVHKFINIQALKILKNDGHTLIYDFFTPYIESINEGVVWADQDFKSSNHFYSPQADKGLYGRSTAMALAQDYYSKSLHLWSLEEQHKSMFYLGAALHIIQDMTIPQHANIRLLDNHRQYENFVKRTYKYAPDYKAETGALVLDHIEEYVRFNARMAMKVYRRFKIIEDDELRFFRISKCILPIAEQTTAGCILTFFHTISDTSDTPPSFVYRNKPKLP